MPENSDNTQLGAVDIVGKIMDSNRADAIDTIHDMLFAKASDAMAQYKQVVANTFFDEPTETETNETDNGTD
jgi:PHP family Zn ribbon phosphoesterase